MIKVIVVTHNGPCFVPKKVFDAIVSKKAEDPNWAEQILFTLELDAATGLRVSVIGGSMPDVRTFAEFDREYIMASPPGRRNIIL
jgi:hypothetical protein